MKTWSTQFYIILNVEIPRILHVLLNNNLLFLYEFFKIETQRDYIAFEYQTYYFSKLSTMVT